MTLSTILTKQSMITAIVAILVGAHVLWEYTHGGVTTHYPLADDSLPGITNWWGILTVPLLTWFSLSRIQKRIKAERGNPEAKAKRVIAGFAVALLFGVSVSLCWELGAEHILPYLILLPVVLSSLIPVHRAKYLLGFVLGMVYTFGGVLPILIGFVLLIMSWTVYQVFYKGGAWVLAKLK